MKVRQNDTPSIFQIQKLLAYCNSCFYKFLYLTIFTADETDPSALAM